MITVNEAEHIIMQQVTDYGTQQVPLSSATGYTLAEDIITDRDLPPWHRPTVDGIAISYASYEVGTRTFTIVATLAAGATPIDITAPTECVEIMTGGPLPETTDTVIRYEDISINNGIATINIAEVKKGQNIHRRGKDKLQGDVVATRNTLITPALISIAASAGKGTLTVKKPPRVVIITTGNELVDVHEQPTPFQIRRSNNHTIAAALLPYHITADMLHIPDDPIITREQIAMCLTSCDVILLSGGVSMGKYDYVPQVLAELSVATLFHKVQQRPGKPFWFGKHSNGTLVFAFPGNPVSVFMCLHRYFIPWLQASLSVPSSPKYAVLDKDINFAIPLQYFAQVNVTVNEQGQLSAMPIEGNGSGDFANLLDSNAFIELPLEKDQFIKGEAYRIGPFKPII